jgi:hypothetical protein
MQFLETDSGSQIFLYNYFKKIYQFYSYPEGKLLKEVPLHMDGPNSVKPFSGGVLTAEDSIWLVNYAPQKIVLINLEGEVQLKRPIYNELFPISYIGVSQQTPLYQIDNKIFTGKITGTRGKRVAGIPGQKEPIKFILRHCMIMKFRFLILNRVRLSIEKRLNLT